MLKKRMIFTLLYNQGAFMLSRNFRLQKVGDLRWLQKNYDFSRVAFSIDELIVLDISRSERDLAQFCVHLKALANGCFVPIAAGGGIRSLSHAKTLLRSGADKVVVNTSLFDNQPLIKELVSNFGRQCIIASIDVKYDPGIGYRVWVENGERCMEGTLAEWLEKILKLPVGDLYLNSIDRDGTGQGYDMRILDELPKSMSIPLIISGGAGHYRHLADGLSENRIDAFATAHLFNFVGDGLIMARMKLLSEKHALAVWDIEKAESLKCAVNAV